MCCSRPIQGGKNDQASVNFNLRAELDSCWNWNTKLLFVYLTAEYETPTNVRAIFVSRFACSMRSSTLLPSEYVTSMSGGQPSRAVGSHVAHARNGFDRCSSASEQVLPDGSRRESQVWQSGRICTGFSFGFSARLALGAASHPRVSLVADRTRQSSQSQPQ